MEEKINNSPQRFLGIGGRNKHKGDKPLPVHLMKLNKDNLVKDIINIVKKYSK